MNRNLLLILTSFFAQSLIGQTVEIKEYFWRYKTGGIIYSSPSIANDGTIYIGSEDNKLHAINPDGTFKWSFQATTDSDWIDSSPALAPDGTIYVGSWDNNLYSINPDTEMPNWIFSTDSLILGSPAIAEDGTIYFGSNDGIFYALNPDGSEKWRLEIGSEIESSPAIGLDGTIYFGAYDGKLYALNTDGTVYWMFDATSDPTVAADRIISSPSIDDDGTIYFGSGNSNVYAINPDGSKKWGFSASGEVDASPIIGNNGIIYVASRGGVLYGLDDTGFPQNQVFIGGVFVSSAVIDDQDNIYIASFIGNNQSIVSAYEEDFVLLWTFTLDNFIDSSPTLSPEGILYIGSYDTYLYAIDAKQVLSKSFWPKFARGINNDGRAGFPPEISAAPNSVIALSNGNAQLDVVASGTEPFTYKWRKDNIIISTQSNATLNLSNLAESNVGVYDVIIENISGQIISPSIALSIYENVLVENPTTAPSLSLNYYRFKDTTKFQFTTESTTNLSTWVNNGITESILEDNSSTQKIKAQSLINNNDLFFMRVNVTAQ